MRMYAYHGSFDGDGVVMYRTINRSSEPIQKLRLTRRMCHIHRDFGISTSFAQ